MPAATSRYEFGIFDGDLRADVQTITLNVAATGEQELFSISHNTEDDPPVVQRATCKATYAINKSFTLARQYLDAFINYYFLGGETQPDTDKFRLIAPHGSANAQLYLSQSFTIENGVAYEMTENTIGGSLSSPNSDMVLTVNYAIQNLARCGKNHGTNVNTSAFGASFAESFDVEMLQPGIAPTAATPGHPATPGQNCIQRISWEITPNPPAPPEGAEWTFDGSLPAIGYFKITWGGNAANIAVYRNATGGGLATEPNFFYAWSEGANKFALDSVFGEGNHQAVWRGETNDTLEIAFIGALAKSPQPLIVAEKFNPEEDLGNLRIDGYRNTPQIVVECTATLTASNPAVYTYGSGEDEHEVTGTPSPFQLALVNGIYEYHYPDSQNFSNIENILTEGTEHTIYALWYEGTPPEPVTIGCTITLAFS